MPASATIAPAQPESRNRPLSQDSPMSGSPVREEQVTPEQETETQESTDALAANPANDFTMAGNPALPPVAAVSTPTMPMQGMSAVNGAPAMSGVSGEIDVSAPDTEASPEAAPPAEMEPVADGAPADAEAEGDAGGESLPEAESEVATEGEGEEGGEGGGASGASAEEFQASGQQMDVEQADPVVSNPDEDPAFQGVMDYTTAVSEAQSTHQTAEESQGQLQAATPRSEEEQATRNDQLAHIGTMSGIAESQEQEKKTFTAESFKALLQEHLDTLSRQMPTNEDEAEDFKDNNPVEAVNESIAGTVNSEKDQLAGPMAQQAEQPEPPASGVETVAPVAPTQEETGPVPEPVDPAAAVPKPLNDSEISMENESQSMDDFMEANEVTEPQLANSNEQAFTGALESKNEAQAQAAAAPAAYRQQESQQLSAARTDAEAQSNEQLTAMHAMRESALGSVLTGQETTAQTDQDKQKIVFDNLQKIYDDTKKQVTEKLDGLSEKVDTVFSTTAESAKNTFEKNVEDKLNEIYGWTVIDDWLFGEDTEAIEGVFNTEKAKFERTMNSVIDELAKLIADELNGTIELIKKGKKDSETYFNSLDAEQRRLGADAFADFNDQYDSLEETVAEKEGELAQGLASSYHENVEALRESFDSIKESVSAGWIGAAFNALAGVIETILKIKDLLLNLLSAVVDAIGAIISDPIGFLSNLIDGIVQGFVNFKNNLLNNIMTGLIEWLTGSLGNVGVTIPDNLFSLAGIFDLVMQILGLTWDYFRDKAVRLLGEPVVQAMETGFEVFMIIKEKGIEGLWEYVKDQFNDLQAMVMDAIRDMIITKVVEAGIKWILGLMSPAGAFIKAAMMIIDIARFFIERAAQIIELVSAFVDGIRALANGDVSAVAKAVEKALVKAIPVLIGFLASLVGITGLTGKVQKIIKKVRGKIDRAINKVIKKAKKAFGKLFKTGKTKSDPRSKEEKEKDLDNAIKDADKLLDEENATPEKVEEKLPDIKKKYNLKNIRLIDLGGGQYQVEAEVNPRKKSDKEKLYTGGNYKLDGGFDAMQSVEGLKIGSNKPVHVLSKHGKHADLEQRLQDDIVAPARGFYSTQKDEIQAEVEKRKQDLDSRNTKILTIEEGLAKGTYSAKSAAKKTDELKSLRKTYRRKADELVPRETKLTALTGLNLDDQQSLLSFIRNDRLFADADQIRGIRQKLELTKFNDNDVFKKLISKAIKENSDKIDKTFKKAEIGDNIHIKAAISKKDAVYAEGIRVTNTGNVEPMGELRELFVTLVKSKDSPPRFVINTAFPKKS